MLDINYIRENIEIVKKAVEEKGIRLDIDELVALDTKKRALIAEVDEMRRAKNLAAAARDIEKGKSVKIKLDTLESSLRSIEGEFDELILNVPNIPSPSSPVGSDASANIEVAKWGEIPQFDFPIKDHVELGKALGILNLEIGTKTSGFRGYYLVGKGAILHWALLQLALQKIVDAGFTPLVPPTLVKKEVLVGSGHFPFGKDNIYKIDGEGDIFLTGTSEPSLLAYYKDTTIDEKDLPIKLCALTHCYRSEVGDYGKDTRGLYRVHEFDKVEQVVICKNDSAIAKDWFDKMQKISEELLQDLGLSYRVVSTSTGDMGAGKFEMNDIETWMPGRGKYGETHSNSNLTDWQARRLNLRLKTKEGKVEYCYTLNNTVLASPRIIIAILENFQQPDSSIKIPEVLHKYTGFTTLP